MQRGAENTGESGVARAVAEAEVSAIKQMAILAAGHENVASLTWGLPSFVTPEHIRRAVAVALEQDRSLGKYTLPDGLPELRALVAQRHREQTGRAVDANDNVLITAGNMQGISSALRTLLDPGDEVILTDPGFASHYQQVALAGGVVRPWVLREEQGWALDVDALEGLINQRTRALILVSPSNPTGTVFAEAELRRVAEIVRAHRLMVLLDDPYSLFIYEQRDNYFNLASVAGLSEHLAYFFSFSKVHAMSGWRLGYGVLPTGFKRQMLKVHDANLICAPHIAQAAGIAALAQPAEHIEVFAQILHRRRQLICERLDRLGGVFDYICPQGAYYVFPRILGTHGSSWELAMALLEKAQVAVTPGSAFGPGGENHVRMAYCVEDDTINLAFDRMETFFAGHC